MANSTIPMADEHEGGCLCGSLRYVARGAPERVTICHCTWCQRRTGSAFGVEVVFQDGNVSVSGETARTYRHLSDETGRWLDQHFCGRCGTKIGITLEAAPGIRSIAAGTFDDPSWISRDSQHFRDIFLRSARDWSALPPDIEAHREHFRK